MNASPSQVDVARDAGVSQRTVSAVLGSGADARVRVSPETARRVRSAASKLGYTPCRYAQLMRGRKSGLIGVLMGDNEADIMYRILVLLDRSLRRHGFRIMVGHLSQPRDVEAYIDDFRGQRAEGVICLRHAFSPTSLRHVPDRLRRLEHVVFLDPPAGWADACFVKPDRRTGIREAGAFLIARGRRRLALIVSGSVGCRKMGAPMQDRLLGYRDIIRAADESGGEERIWCDAGLLDPDRHMDQLARAIDELVIAKGVDAILASNDAVAIRLVAMLQARGLRVPEDVAVIGYDNHAMSMMTVPRLTTIDHNLPQIAEELTVLLTSWIEKGCVPDGERQRIVKPELVVRESA